MDNDLDDAEDGTSFCLAHAEMQLLFDVLHLVIDQGEQVLPSLDDIDEQLSVLIPLTAMRDVAMKFRLVGFVPTWEQDLVSECEHCGEEEQPDNY